MSDGRGVRDLGVNMFILGIVYGLCPETDTLVWGIIIVVGSFIEWLRDK